MAEKLPGIIDNRGDNKVLHALQYFIWNILGPLLAQNTLLGWYSEENRRLVGFASSMSKLFAD
ncbi:MAG: hypothetical protein FVQ85_19460 [Planctomycetes bacterium]|nr:hypothetical protein [Planctomycetota bacterium]